MKLQQKIKLLLALSPHNCRSLSVDLGHNHAYISQYLQRGTPRQLSARDCLKLAQIFNVSMDELVDDKRPLTTETLATLLELPGTAFDTRPYTL